jgi:Spy/CpxP family protein refolding chaperone
MKHASRPFLTFLAVVTAIATPILLVAAEEGATDETTVTAGERAGRGAGRAGRGRGEQPAAAEGRGARGLGRGGLGAGQVERLDAALSLTDAQKEQITAIYENARAEMQAGRRGGNAEAPDMATVQAAIREDVRAVLTAKQQAVYDELEPPARGRGGRGNAEGAGRGGRGGRGAGGPRGGADPGGA